MVPRSSEPFRFLVLFLIMIALWSTADHYVFALWFLLPCSFFFSSPNLSRRRLDVYHTSTHGVALVHANLRCRSETCRTRLAGNTGRQISPKIRHLGTNAQLCRAISLQLYKARIEIGKTC